MKVLKIILIVIVALIALVLIGAAFVDGKFSVERSIVIDRPNDMVYDYVLQLKKQPEWSVWEKMDPNTEHTYTGTDGEVGFISAWVGNKDVGAGEQEITAIDPGKRIDYELRFKEPFESTSKAYTALNLVGHNQTELTMGFEGEMGYPMRLMLLFMNMDEALGADFQSNLENIKEILESQPVIEEEPEPFVEEDEFGDSDEAMMEEGTMMQE
jgi:uncharacterized protein YndB with AHSA1/START domain